MDIDNVLAAIGSTESTDFNEFCRGLRGCPEKGDRAGWREVFSLLRQAENDGLVEVDRQGRDINSMILTEAGRDRVREALDSKRGLLSYQQETLDEYPE